MLHCFWHGRTCGALGTDSRFLGPAPPLCVSLSHCTLLALCTAEEAPQQIEAVHHHQSRCAACVCICVCMPSPQVSHETHTTLEQQTNTAATTKPARVPRWFQIYREHCWLPFFLHSNALMLLHHKFTLSNVPLTETDFSFVEIFMVATDNIVIPASVNC